MNKRKKNDRDFSLLEMILMGLAAVALLGGGVVHSWLKNSQVEVFHEMDRTQRRISEKESIINSLQVKIDKKLNIYQLRDDLAQSGSKLVVLPVSAIEKIPAYRGEDMVAATTENVNSTLAQSSP